jgi:hypothetical protein
VIHRFNAVPVKIPASFLKIVNIDPEIHIKSQSSLAVKANLRKNKSGNTTLPDFKVSYKATIITPVFYWWKN